MPGQTFKIKSNDPWSAISIPEGETLAVGTRVYQGLQKMLVDGKETEVANSCYGGEYPLDNGQYITVVDGVITEINDLPKESAGALKAMAKAREQEYKKRK